MTVTYSPAATRVHNRRVVEIFQHGMWEANVKDGQYHRGVFEKEFGYPTDVDKVWAAREAAATKGEKCMLTFEEATASHVLY